MRGPAKPPAAVRDAVDAFIAKRRQNRFLGHPVTLAEDLDREGLWPGVTADQVARYAPLPAKGADR